MIRPFGGGRLIRNRRVGKDLWKFRLSPCMSGDAETFQRTKEQAWQASVKKSGSRVAPDLLRDSPRF